MRLLGARDGAAVVLGLDVRVCYCGVQAQTHSLPLIMLALLCVGTWSARERPSAAPQQKRENGVSECNPVKSAPRQLLGQGGARESHAAQSTTCIVLFLHAICRSRACLYVKM
jgi:hypothetical protein